jgi:hypothetical protein
MNTQYKLILRGTSNRKVASKYIVQRSGWSGPPTNQVKSWLGVGETSYNPDGDSYIIDPEAIPGEAHRYRFKPVLKARDSDWVYFTERIPPPVTPRGMCAPTEPTWYTYTVTHTIPDLTGYYKLLPEKIAHNSNNSKVCFIYNPNLKIWLFIRLQTGITVEAVRGATTLDIINQLGVYYYSATDHGDWIPMNDQLWTNGSKYNNHPILGGQKPEISCYYAIPEPAATPHPATPLPNGPPEIPPTPSPSAGPTSPDMILHESGLPLLAETGDYFAREQ